MARDAFEENPPGALTEVQAREVARWLYEAAALVGLREWRWRVSTHEAKEGADATSFVLDQSDESVVAVASDFAGRSEEDQRHTLTHELLHPHFYRITRLMDKLVERELGQRTELIMSTAVHEVEEQTIDRLAWALAKLLPPLRLPK